MSLMPKSLFAVLVLLGIPAIGVAGAADSFILVSDVDATVKVTNVNDLAAAVKSAVAKLVFAGMPELYRELLGGTSSAGRLEFLSGSPSFLHCRITELLTGAYFPTYKLTLRGWRDLFRATRNYKARHMQEMYDASKDDLLLVGDDTESDPEVYAAFSDQRPTVQVRAIYIHRITGRTLPPRSIAFVTAYDIAMEEYMARRLTEKQAALVGNAVLTSRDRVFLPDFQACPKEHRQMTGLPYELMQIKNYIESRMDAICSQRLQRHGSQ